MVIDEWPLIEAVLAPAAALLAILLEWKWFLQKLFTFCFLALSLSYKIVNFAHAKIIDERAEGPFETLTSKKP